MRGRLSLLAVCATVSFALIGQLAVVVSPSIPSATMPPAYATSSDMLCMHCRGSDQKSAAATAAMISISLMPHPVGPDVTRQLLVTSARVSDLP